MALSSAALAALCLLVAGPAHAEWLSPGPLAKAHADLDDESGCNRCHEPGGRVSQKRCLGCHTDVAIPLEQRRGYHAQLVRESGRGCEGCHSDHKGRTYPLIRWSPPPGFDHRTATGFDLTGAHATVGCGACHEDRPRYMGEPTTCAGCHDDPHAGDLGTSCDRCHTTRTFRPAEAFSHARTDFPLEGRHADAACTGCHTPASDGHVRYALEGFERCSSCHEDPHRGRTSLSPCSACHEPTGWHDTRGLPPAHSPAGWPLVGKHQGVSCRDCHGSDLTATVSRECVTCHADPHGGRFGTDCDACHDESGWRVTGRTAGRFDHSRTRYPLRGRHRRVDCRRCHTGSGSYAAVWRGPRFDSCDRCHRGWHPAESLVTAPSPTTCEICHTVQGFDPSTFTAERHQEATFQLEGSHLATACASCHVREPPKPTPLRLEAQMCGDCHQDPHGGQFDAQMGSGSCETCHTPRAWRDRGFDHDETRFPLRGVHARAACESCHPGAPEQPYADAPHECAGCHRDPHLGQFRTPPDPKTCDTCHTPEAWPIEPFDHGLLADWPLEGAHAEVTCRSCHGTVRTDLAPPVTQWRLGYRSCASCHTNPHRRGGRR